MVDYTKAQLISTAPIDKIFDENSFTATVAACPDPTTAPSVTVVQRANPYGTAGFVTAAYSLDGTNFYNQDTSTTYWDTVTAQPFQQIIMATACSATTIYFLIQSFYRPSALTLTINYAVDSQT